MNLDAQIQKLKEMVAESNSLENLKEVLRFSMEYSRDCVSEFSKEFKKRIS